MESKRYTEDWESVIPRSHAIGRPARGATLTGTTRVDDRHALQLLAVFCLALLLPPGTAIAQSAFGLISGSVTDEQDASIPGATVTVINEGTGTRQTTQTNASGYFVFPALLPATYTVTAEKQGFKKLEKTGIVLVSSQRLSTGNLLLSLGSTQTILTVSGTGTPVETTSSQNSATISASEISALPSLGRDYMALMRVLPGSNYIGEGNSSLSVVSSQAYFNGLNQPTATYVSTNGVFSSISNYSWDSAESTLDNIQDIHVLESNYEAQYGRVQGAVINVTTKSGTSQFHGGAYYYLRNEALNANDFFNNRNDLPKPRYRYNTLGGTFGGPLWGPGAFKSLKNKLFFFFDYDNEPSTVPAGPRYYIMPTAVERQGDFSQSYIPGTNTLYTVLDPLTGKQFPGNVIPSSRINPLMQKVLNIFPLPNFTNRAVSNREYNYVISDSNSQPTNLESLRFDYAPATKWRIFGRWQRAYFGQTGRNTTTGILGGWLNGTQSYDNRYQRIEFGGTYTFNPHMVNQLAAGWTRSYEWTVAPSSTLSQFQSSALGISFPNPYPNLNPLDLLPAMSFANGASWGYDPRLPLNDQTTGWSISDGLTDIVGNHQLKFGVYLDSETSYQPHHTGQSESAGSGDFTFSAPNPNNPFNTGNSYAEGLLGYFDTYTAAATRVDLDMIANTFEWYAQDNWRVTKRLTLNYGLRFSKDIPQKNGNSYGSRIDFSQYNPADAPPLFQPVIVNGTRMMKNPVTGALEPAAYEGYFVPGVGNPAPGSISVGNKGLFEGKGVLVAPRFGFAYDPFGTGTTVVRGGFGMFYSPRTFAGQIYGTVTSAPTIFYPTQFYGNVATFTTQTALLSPSSDQYMDPSAGLPYSLEWSLGIQRAIGFKTVLDVSYIANAARHGNYSFNANQVPYGAEFLPKNRDPTTGTPLPDEYFVPYPGYASISYHEWGDNSNYQSLQVTLDRPGSVAPATIWSHKASIVPPVTTASLPGRVPAAWRHRHHRRHLRLGDAHRLQQLGVPVPVRVQGPSDGGDPGVDGRHCRRVRRWPPPGRANSPAPRGPPADAQRKEPLGVGHGPRQEDRTSPFDLGPTLAVAVEQARQHRHALTADRRERRHHGGHRHAGQRMPLLGQLCGHLLERLSRTGPPGPLGVVAQDVGLGRHHAVGHPAAGNDLARPRPRPRLHRRGARRRRRL